MDKDSCHSIILEGKTSSIKLKEDIGSNKITYIIYSVLIHKYIHLHIDIIINICVLALRNETEVGNLVSEILTKIVK